MRRLEGVQAGLGGGSEVLDLGIGWDDLGRVAFRSDGNRPLAGGGTFVEDFVHDDLDRITSATIAGGPSVGFDYSPGGRLETKSDVGSYHYGEGGAGPDQLTSLTGATTASFVHDDAGNVTDTLGRSLDYSSYDKPTLIASAAAALSFHYGVDRRRTRQVKAVTGQATLETTYVGTLYEASENLQTGVVEHRHWVMADGRRVALLVTEDASSARETRYLHPDHLQSVAVVTDDQGVPVARYFYDVWGRPVDADGAPLSGRPDASARGFTDHEHLDAVGLVHANARVLDPRLGVFLAIDPIVALRDPQSVAPYSYVRNNPQELSDPSGAYPLRLTLIPLLDSKNGWMQMARWGAANANPFSSSTGDKNDGSTKMAGDRGGRQHADADGGRYADSESQSGSSDFQLASGNVEGVPVDQLTGKEWTAIGKAAAGMLGEIKDLTTTEFADKFGAERMLKWQGGDLELGINQQVMVRDLNTIINSSIRHSIASNLEAVRQQAIESILLAPAMHAGGLARAAALGYKAASFSHSGSFGFATATCGIGAGCGVTYQRAY